ncbi:type II secretion system protein [Actinomyces oris]|uniref:type II secretion system protein n=1 Tax=Actinomyces TaxID=1654 RepID=UPI0039BDA6FE
MGIEIWAVIALITVLSVYLLPLLVGRREMARRSNVQDRYSAELRVLATGAAAVERDDTCANSGHAELFRRRPEVRVMNRPAVRNVRALRTERELDRARQVHAQGRERRRVAASHRGIVASVLLGVTLGAWVLGLVTALPWWPALLPSALLGASMVAGRRAALASAAADRRECRRIAELEQTLVTLTGRRSSASVVAAPRSVVDGPRSASSGAVSAVSASAASPAVSAVSAESVEAAGDSGAQDSFIERLTREGVQRPAARSVSAESAGSTESAVSAEPVAGSPSEATGTTAARPSRAVDSEEERLARLDADLDDETAAAVAAEREATRRASVYVPSRHAGRVTRDMGVREAVSRDGDEESSPRTKDFVASLPASTSRSLSGWGKLFAEASAIEQEAQERAAAAPSPQAAAEPARRAADSAPQAASRTASEPAPTAARPQAPAAAAPAATEGVVKEEATTSTPPQGWRPVHVPAPTYTLAARAPRRSYADPVVDPGTSAPVPARPQSARGYIPAPVEDEEELFHPIDLDAILEGRRAAGE